MDRTGMLRGKENVEQQESGRMSEHAAKVKEAREARRKRILARSSERLAFITGEANAIPTSPLLDLKGNSLISQDSPYSSSDQGSTIKKSLFNEHEQAEEQKMPASIKEYTSKAGAAEGLHLKNKETLEAARNQAGHESKKENPVTLESKFSNCIKRSFFPRLVSATCVAMAFLAMRFAQSSGLLGVYVSTTSVFADSRHISHLDALAMIYYSLVVVMLVDLLLFMGAFFFSGTEHLKMMRSRKAMANKATLSILSHLLFSISLDCSLSASLLSGGFLVLSKYFPSHIS